MTQPKQKKDQIMAFSVTAEMLNFVRVPKNLWNTSLTQVPQKCSHKSLVRAYLENIEENVLNGQGLYLWGDYGRGKSAIAAMILKAAAAKQKLGLWIRAKNLPEFIINDVLFDYDQTVMQRAEECSLLVIDEFQIRNNLGFYETAIEDLIRLRISQNKATVVTSNVALPELREKFPPLYSVLQEALYPIKVQGHDFRAEKKGQVDG